ncbi:MAG TPA: hypothetical protein VK518_01775, partial [Puia sp.]|nr:hypothetical protein [Puia sp.]
MENLREQILILVSTPLYLIIIGLEVLLSNYRHRKPGHGSAGQSPLKKAYTWKDTLTNVYLMLMNSI